MPTMRSGFTLIELLVVAAIMLIMTTVFFANYNGNDKKGRNDVESAARQVAAQIRALQNEALSGKKIGNDYVYYFKFDVVSGSSVFTINYAKSSGVGDTLGSGQPFNLAKNRITFGNDVNLYFESPSGKPNAAKQITIKSTIKATEAMCVQISIAGSVTEEKGACS